MTNPPLRRARQDHRDHPDHGRRTSRRARTITGLTAAALVAGGGFHLAGNTKAGEGNRDAGNTGNASGVAGGAAASQVEGTPFAPYVDTFGLKKADLDIEGAALPDTHANDPRAKAVASLQQSHPGPDVSHPLPVLPEGLTRPGVARVKKSADSKGMGRVSMWSGTRDKACPGGPREETGPTCPSIDQSAHAFSEAFTQ